MKVRRSIIVLTLVTLVLPLAIFARRANQSAATSQSAAASTTLTQYEVETGVVEVVVSAVGSVEADQVANVGFTTPGRIAEVLVEAGDTVRTGDVLARQNDETQRLAVEAAELALASAQLQKDNLLAGPSESDLLIAEANIDAAIGAYNSIANAFSDEQIRAAELQVAAAEQALADAQTARSTANGSPEQIALMDAQIGEASFNAEIARLNLETAQQGTSAQSGAAWARVLQAEAQRDQLLAGATQAQLDSADAAIARAQINLDSANDALAKTVIAAPFDGVVTAVTGSAGAITLPGLAVVEISDISPLRVKVQVDEIDIRQVREGMAARVRVDALPSLDLVARLERIALVPSLESGIVTYGVDVVVLEADPRVRLGMTAETQVVVERREDVLVVPNQYIRLDRLTGDAYVNVLLADGTLQELAVTLGLQGADTSEIVGGLRAGDVVAVDLGSDALPGLGG